MLANPDMTEDEFEKLYEDVVKLVGPGQPRKSFMTVAYRLARWYICLVFPDRWRDQ
jgi:hypothetical protein